MNVDQIVKQVDWLDDERRKDQTRIGSLEERINALDGNISTLISKVNDQTSQLSRMETLLTRMNGYDEDLLQTRLDLKRGLEDLEKQFRKREEDLSAVRQKEIGSIDKSILEIRKDLEQVQEIKRGLSARVEEETRMLRLIEEIKSDIAGVERSQEEYTRTVKLINDSQRQDAKRLTDLHGEVSGLRKRADEHRSTIDLNSANHKKFEARLNEFALTDIERREAMEKFLESQTIRDVERERTWKDWQNRFNIVENQAAELENHLEIMETTRRDLSRTHKSVEDLSQQVERRVSEITEVQRLADERFRQEWVTFKADDQKRWTNYTLTVDEQRAEMLRQFEKVSERVTNLEDDLQELQDVYTQISEQTIQRMQTLLSNIHDWVSIHERTLGRS
jgi:chromosome segregation ATPase